VFGPISGDVALAESDLSLVGPSGSFCGHGSDLADVNADGFDDAIIGAYNDDSGANNGGKLYVEFGPLSGEIDLSTSPGEKIIGELAESYPGRAIQAGQDVDGDGVGDIVTNMVFDSRGGIAAGGLYVIDGPADITTYDEAGGTLIGPGTYALAGGVFTVGDFDGDGLADIAAYSAAPSPTGVYIVRGPARGEIAMADSDVIIEAPSAIVQFGMGIGAGDLEQDGQDELLIGAPYDTAGGSHSGVTYLVADPPTGTSSVLDVAVATFQGTTPDDYTGTSAAIGDLDGDSIGEVIIGGTGIGNGGGVFVESL
jgi:hypothetical protein